MIKEQAEILDVRKQVLRDKEAGATTVRCTHCTAKNAIPFANENAEVKCVRCDARLPTPAVYEKLLQKEHQKQLHADKDEARGRNRPDRSPSVASSCVSSSEVGDDGEAADTPTKETGGRSRDGDSDDTRRHPGDGAKYSDTAAFGPGDRRTDKRIRGKGNGSSWNARTHGVQRYVTAMRRHHRVQQKTLQM